MQASGLLDPRTETEPLAQGVHFLAPGATLYVSMGHCTQDDALAAYCPAGQSPPHPTTNEWYLASFFRTLASPSNLRHRSIPLSPWG